MQKVSNRSFMHRSVHTPGTYIAGWADGQRWNNRVGRWVGLTRAWAVVGDVPYKSRKFCLQKVSKWDKKSLSPEKRKMIYPFWWLDCGTAFWLVRSVTLATRWWFHRPNGHGSSPETSPRRTQPARSRKNVQQINTLLQSIKSVSDILPWRCGVTKRQLVEAIRTGNARGSAQLNNSNLLCQHNVQWWTSDPETSAACKTPPRYFFQIYLTKTFSSNQTM